MLFKKLIFLIGLLFIISCGSWPTEYRKEGFKLLQQGYNSIEAGTTPFHVTVNLKNVKVHIVSNRKYFSWEKAREKKYGIIEYANRKNEVWLLGKIVMTPDGPKIIVNQAVLGHGLNHLLNYKNPQIAHPDKLDKYGY